MDEFNIYRDIAGRTDGDIYIGVVGPVRTGKSTFIKQFMDKIVLPMIDDKFVKERTKDELPQSATGKMIMTTEPKFVPEEAINIKMEENFDFKVRMIDCVGYTVPGAVGYEDEDGPRMVTTPWYQHEIPFQEAAEVGTQKVINEHSTIGLVVTTDGSFSDISRNNFIRAEERVIDELKIIGKPFVIVLNSTQPQAKATQDLTAELNEKYEVPVIPVDCLNIGKNDIYAILRRVLYEFPVKELYIDLPGWINNLESNHWLRESYDITVKDAVKNVDKVRDIYTLIDSLADNDNTREVYLENVNLGEGQARIVIGVAENLFFDIIQEMSGYDVEDKKDLMSLIDKLSQAKVKYDRVARALKEVNEQGYGIVTPDLTDMSFKQPEILKRGNQFGVKLMATAPSIHMIRADINAEVSPVVGTEKKSEEIISFLRRDFDDDPEAIWKTEFLGRSLHELVQESITGKLYRMPDSARTKIKNTIEKIVNEGSGGLICIIL